MFMKDKLIDNIMSDDTLIYHYTSFNSACMILDTKRVRLSGLVNTNDPLEFMDKSLNIIEHDIHNTTRTIDCELNKSFVERQNIVRLLCFSVDFPCIGEEKIRNILVIYCSRDGLAVECGHNMLIIIEVFV